jgi:hypothetical protein
MSLAAIRVLTAIKGPGIRWPLLWTAVVVGSLVWGSHAHLERYITPKRGLGYWLGIVGGSMMVLLLLYSARKRIPWLHWMGGMPTWFEFHMVLGIIGPVLILFHSNFSLGGSNSNVALISMLLVATSGLIGRYIYTRLHARLDGHEETRAQLNALGVRLRTEWASISFLPALLDEIDLVEKRLLRSPKGFIRQFLRLFTGAPRIVIARWLIRREIKQALIIALRHDSAVTPRHAHRVASVVRHYADRCLKAGRRTSEYRMYERLFSLWHVLHIPLFFTLLIAAIVHVIAVNLY